MISINVIDDLVEDSNVREKILTINNTKNKNKNNNQNNENQQYIFSNNICFFCKKEKISNFKFNFSFLFNFFEKKIKYNNEIRQELNEISKNYYDILIQPCKCKLYCHFICLLQYCIINLSIKCDECLMNYNFKLTELNSAKIGKCIIFKSIFFTSFVFILLLCGLFFLLNDIIKPDEYIFWNYIIGIILIILSLLTFIPAYNSLGNLKSQKKIFPFFLDYNNNECKNLDNSIIKNNLFGFETFLSKIFEIDKSDLIEKKMFNQICVSSKISREKELYKYIIENNELLEKEEKIFEEMKKKKNSLSTQNEKRKSKLNGISISFAENTNTNNPENNNFESNNDENSYNNLQFQFSQKSNCKNLLMLQRRSFPLIGLKCKSNRRLSARGSFVVEKVPEVIDNGNCLNDDNNSINNKSELNNLKDKDLQNKKKNLLKSVIIPKKSKKDQNIQKKVFESDIKHYCKKSQKNSPIKIQNSGNLFKDNILEGGNDINVIFDKK